VSPVSAVRANGVAQLTGYAATVRIRLAILVTLAAWAGSLGGCKDHDVDRLAAVKRDVCACKDARCADQAMTEVPKTAIRSTPRTQAIARDILECRARLEAADRPSTDPDAEGRGEPAPAGAGSAPAPAAPAPAPPESAPAKPAPPKAAR
jgi:hypothetical protein